MPLERVLDWGGIQPGAYLLRVAQEPKPVFVAVWPEAGTPNRFEECMHASIRQARDLFPERILWSRSRCVESGRLVNVLKHGIDVLPVDSHFYAAEGWSKSMEYGGCNKVLLALDATCLLATFREVPSAIPAAEMNDLLRIYPTRIDSEDRSKAWLTRLPQSDPRATTEYEIAYARWIPGDPMDALLALVLVTEDPAGALHDLVLCCLRDQAVAARWPEVLRLVAR